MKININDPVFVSFLDNITGGILSVIRVDNYFTLPNENKFALTYTVFQYLVTTTKIKVKLSDVELKSLIVILLKKNEENENYELAAILQELLKNFDKISVLSNNVNEIKKENKKRKVTNNP